MMMMKDERSGGAEKKKWGRMIERYLYDSEMLRAVFLLVDIRHDPTLNDRQMFDWIQYMGYQTIGSPEIITVIHKLQGQINIFITIGS